MNHHQSGPAGSPPPTSTTTAPKTRENGSSTPRCISSATRGFFGQGTPVAISPTYHCGLCNRHATVCHLLTSDHNRRAALSTPWAGSRKLPEWMMQWRAPRTDAEGAGLSHNGSRMSGRSTPPISIEGVQSSDALSATTTSPARRVTVARVKLAWREDAGWHSSSPTTATNVPVEKRSWWCQPPFRLAVRAKSI